jgi:hypothetical protein
MTFNSNNAETLFKRLDIQLFETLEEQYFLQPRYLFVIIITLANNYTYIGIHIIIVVIAVLLRVKAT